MSGENNLIEVSEFNEQVLAELAAGGAHVDALINFLKESFVCDFSNFPTLINTSDMRAAAASLIEKASPSTYRRRLTVRGYLNADSLENNRTNIWQTGPTGGATYAAATRLLAFATKEGDSEDLFSDQTTSAYTVRNGGAYRISFNGLVAGFANMATGTQLLMPSTTTHRFTADTGVTGMPVDIVMKVTSAGASKYITLATIMMYPSDFSLYRARPIGGDITARLVAGSVVSFFLQRRGKQGTYLGLTDSVNYQEAIGFTKNTVTIPGTVAPARDGFNYFEITRLT